MNRRRRLLALLAFAPAAAWAQPAPGMHRIGVLSAGHNPKAKDHPNWPTFFAAMRKLGYEEGRNVSYEVRSAEGTIARLPQLARDLIASGVQIIVVTGSSEANAAFRATATLPIVMIHTAAPVELGLAVSLARPGRNVTGLMAAIAGFDAKAFALLTEALPHAKRIGALGNPSHVSYPNFRQEIERTAAGKGVTLLPTVEARRPEELDSAFARIAEDKPHALLVQSDVIFFVHRRRIIAFAAQAKLPVMYRFTEDVEVGGLMAFATQFRDLYARAPEFVDKILKGAKPGDLPIEQPTRFGLWVNLNTARALDVKIPPAVLLQADRVIE